MTIPSADDQIRFLRDIQALLDDGQFTATYKFALLIALSDIAVESGVADGRTLWIDVDAVAAKLIDYYWQQSSPFLGRDAAQVLLQNNGRQAAIVSELVRLRNEGIASLAELRASGVLYRKAVRKVARITRDMPLFRLQLVAGEPRPFLYAHELVDGGIRLHPGVAYHLRQFHTLITGMARDRWTSMVRQMRENLYLVGQTRDLETFLFGSAREPIRHRLDMLLDAQRGRCLYCSLEIAPASAHVDHFVPWILHRCDALPNLVAAHSECNLAKKDWLAAEIHLERWVRRNLEWDPPESIPTHPGDAWTWDTVKSLTRWAYDRAYDLGLPTWVRRRETARLSPGYVRFFH